MFHISIWGGLELCLGTKPKAPPWRRDWWIFEVSRKAFRISGSGSRLKWVGYPCPVANSLSCRISNRQTGYWSSLRNAWPGAGISLCAGADGVKLAISQVRNFAWHRARNTFGARMLGPKIFREQMYCTEVSTCDICWDFYLPSSDFATGALCPSFATRYAPGYNCIMYLTCFLSREYSLPANKGYF